MCAVRRSLKNKLARLIKIAGFDIFSELNIVMNSEYLSSRASAGRLADFDGLLRIDLRGLGHSASYDFLEKTLRLSETVKYRIPPSLSTEISMVQALLLLLLLLPVVSRVLLNQCGERILVRLKGALFVHLTHIYVYYTMPVFLDL